MSVFKAKTFLEDIKMISKINWEALKGTKTDDRNHQLGETIYKHHQFPEKIVATLHRTIWVCYKITGKWTRPIRLYHAARRLYH